MRIIKKAMVVFADAKTEKEFSKLNDHDEIKRYLKRAIEDIKQNAFCGIPIPKRLIPREYVQKHGTKNLWKYDLPDGWRIVYSIITPNKVEILAVILEWFDHSDYEKRFEY